MNINILISVFILAPRGYTPSPQNGEIPHPKFSASKIDVIKNWSVSTYKCTKQLINEKLGKSSKTVDIGKNICISNSYNF